VVGEEGGLVSAPVGLGQRALQEIAHVVGPVPAADHLPVQEPDRVVGQQVGVADVRVTVQEGLRTGAQAADVGGPHVDQTVGVEVSHRVGQHVTGGGDA